MNPEDVGIEDVWFSRDLPLLRKTVRSIDSGRGRHECGKLAQAAGLDEETGRRAFLSLERHGHVELHKAGGNVPLFVRDVGPDAYRLTGAYPDPATIATRLITELERAEADAPESDKGKFRRALDGVTGVGRDVLVEVVGAAITGRIPMG